MSDPAIWARRLRNARIVVYVVLLAGVAYSVWRFDVVRLPVEGCSPLVGYEPGDRLLVDRAPGAPRVGEAVLFESPQGELLLGRIEDPPGSAPAEVWRACRAGAFWIVGERSDCPGPDSRLFGPVRPDALRGRIVFALPW